MKEKKLLYRNLGFNSVDVFNLPVDSIYKIRHLRQKNVTVRWKLHTSHDRYRATFRNVCTGAKKICPLPLSKRMIFFYVFCMITAVSLQGCVTGGPQQKKKTTPAQGQKLPRIPQIGGKSAMTTVTRIPYIIFIRVIAVQVPTGMASKSEELWSYLDEEPVSMQSAVLGLNGIRVGVGRASAWADVERMLKKMTGLVYQDSTIQTFGGQIKKIELKTNQPEQTICIFREDMTLFGADYPKGDNIWAVSCTIDEEDYNKIILTGVPQIRTTKRFIQYVKKYGSLKPVAKTKLYSFRRLTFQLALSNNDFLIIGPGIESRRLTSLGHHFLTKNVEGIEHETILILRPQVHRIKYKQ